MKTFVLGIWGILCCAPTISAQSTTTLTYDVKGNRISKNTQGSSRQPEVTADPLAVVLGQPATLSANGCPGTVKWSSGKQGANIQVVPTITTTYSASCIVASCASNGIGKVTVDVINCISDEVTVAASATFVRYGQPITLMAYGCSGTIEWSSGQAGNSLIINAYGPVSQFTATCTKPYCPNAGAASAYVGGTTGCATGDVLTTVKSGNWNDPTVWSCGRVPTLNDEVYLGNGHIVSVNVTGYAKMLIQGGGQLAYLPSNPEYMIIFPTY